MLRHERPCRHEHKGLLDEPAHIVAGFVLCPFERVGNFGELPGVRVAAAAGQLHCGASAG